jgi:hypothetical protein
MLVYFGVSYQITVRCLVPIDGLVVWTLWWWVAMRCHHIKLIWFNLFEIDSSILTIQNSNALHNCGMRPKGRGRTSPSSSTCARRTSTFPCTSIFSYTSSGWNPTRVPRIRMWLVAPGFSSSRSILLSTSWCHWLVPIRGGMPSGSTPPTTSHRFHATSLSGTALEVPLNNGEILT